MKAKALPKKKKCRVTTCRAEFVPTMPMQIVCGPKCALNMVVAKREKEAQATAKVERAKHREAKKRVKRKGEYMKEAQAEFNGFIRERDYIEPCISCDKHHTGQYHAGHYLSVGARPELRFNELNVHKQCSVCNNHLSGNLILYRVNLAKKVGADVIDFLEGPHKPQRYTIEELESIKAKYRAKKRELEKARNGDCNG